MLKAKGDDQRIDDSSHRSAAPARGEEGFGLTYQILEKIKCEFADRISIRQIGGLATEQAHEGRAHWR